MPNLCEKLFRNNIHSFSGHLCNGIACVLCAHNLPSFLFYIQTQYPTNPAVRCDNTTSTTNLMPKESAMDLDDADCFCPIPVDCATSTTGLEPNNCSTSTTDLELRQDKSRVTFGYFTRVKSGNNQTFVVPEESSIWITDCFRSTFRENSIKLFNIYNPTHCWLLITWLNRVAYVNDSIVAVIFGSRRCFIDNDVGEEGFFPDDFFGEINSVWFSVICVVFHVAGGKWSAMEKRCWNRKRDEHKGESVIMRYKYLISTVQCGENSINSESTRTFAPPDLYSDRKRVFWVGTSPRSPRAISTRRHRVPKGDCTSRFSDGRQRWGQCRCSCTAWVRPCDATNQGTPEIEFNLEFSFQLELFAYLQDWRITGGVSRDGADCGGYAWKESRRREENSTVSDFQPRHDNLFGIVQVFIVHRPVIGEIIGNQVPLFERL